MHLSTSPARLSFQVSYIYMRAILYPLYITAKITLDAISLAEAVIGPTMSTAPHALLRASWAIESHF